MSDERSGRGMENCKRGNEKMEEKTTDLFFREIGKGFIVCKTEDIFGRMLTKTYVDQNKKTYVKIGGEYIPLTEKHNFLPA
jgi:hypothetical protein